VLRFQEWRSLLCRRAKYGSGRATLKSWDGPFEASIHSSWERTESRFYDLHADSIYHGKDLTHLSRSSVYFRPKQSSKTFPHRKLKCSKIDKFLSLKLTVSLNQAWTRGIKSYLSHWHVRISQRFDRIWSKFLYRVVASAWSLLHLDFGAAKSSLFEIICSWYLKTFLLLLHFWNLVYFSVSLYVYFRNWVKSSTVSSSVR